MPRGVPWARSPRARTPSEDEYDDDEYDDDEFDDDDDCDEALDTPDADATTADPPDEPEPLT